MSDTENDFENDFEIAREHGIGPEQFHRDYLAPQLPVIMTGVVDDWPAVRSWDPDYLKNRYPDSAIRYEVWDGDESVHDPVDFHNRMRYVDTTIAEFVDLVRSTGAPTRKIYSAEFPLFDEIPELLRDIGSLEEYMNFPRIYPRRLRRRLQIKPAMWFGPAGTVGVLHFDRAHNLYTQVHGRKRWTIIPPQDTPYLYWPSEDFRLGFLHFSPVDLENPDRERFPLFKNARRCRFVLEPGELLFLPATWWHHTRGLETSISLNFFWLDLWNNAFALRGYLYHMARSGLRQKLGKWLFQAR